VRAHDPYCERSAALGEAFPDLVGGVIGLAVGLVRGSVIAARRLTEDAVWMDSSGRCCDGCGARHRVIISDCGPCASCCGCSWCR
jgi:hypothetical protein